MNKYKLFLSGLIFIIFTFFQSIPAWAHVKWFSEFSFIDKPKTVSETMDMSFWVLMILSIACIGLLAFLDYRLTAVTWTKQVTRWLEGYKKYAETILRVGMGMVLLLSFQSATLFAPELTVSAWIGWIQFILAILLLFGRMIPLAGASIVLLYIYGISQFHLFHMLDYATFLGTGYFLMVSRSKEHIKATGLIALYLTVGFSLSWVAIEKLLYPQWGLYVLEQNPQLALGLNMKFFLMAAAFIEISLGYLLMICLLQRPLALIITLVFFLTTLVFGKMEVIGHTIIHAALIVFLIEGPGKTYKAPIHLHKSLPLRIAFACVNFVVFMMALMVVYENFAMTKYQLAAQKMQGEVGVEVSKEAAPQIDLELFEDKFSGYALHIKTDHFRFAPEHTGGVHVPQEGHAHIFIDNKKVGRAYAPWIYIAPQGPGVHQIKVTLNTNDHRHYLFNGKPIESKLILKGIVKETECVHNNF